MITRRNFLRVAGCGTIGVIAPSARAGLKNSARPSFVWLVSEDNSKHFLRLFDKNGATTPRIEELARDGVVFTRAFSNCPVCSAARSNLATGCYGARVGTQHHRAFKRVGLPEGVRPFHSYLRQAGYFTSNRKKTDYNFVDVKDTWESSKDWRGRKPKQPFFHMESFGVSHEYNLHGRIPDAPKDAPVYIPPIHPDTRIFRNTYAHYHKRIGVMDKAIGRVVDALKKDDLLEDTFVFYFGDHGGVLPGSKGYAYETGLHVPLVVRIPEKWKHLVDLKRGSRVGGFVSFVDFGPTLLHLAGLKVPAAMDGTAFMGPGITLADLSKRDETFGFADRFGEKYDLVRTLRKGRFKYIRNYQPFNFDALQNNYRYKMAAYSQWRELHHAGKLNATQSQFFKPRAAECLYDIKTDPYETRDLAAEPEYADRLADLRTRLAAKIKGLPDLSILPESLLAKEGLGDPVAFGRKHKAEIAKLVDIADLSLVPFAEAKAGIQAALSSENRWERYWGLIVCSSHDKAADCFVAEAKQMAKDDVELLVRVRAAEFLGLIGAADPRPVLTDVLSSAEHPLDALLTLNTVVLLRDGKPACKFAITQKDVKAKCGGITNRLLYLAR